MAKGERYISTMCRINEICCIVLLHYEPGNQSKCYKAIWRKYIEPKYGVCYRTFLNYINAPTSSADINNHKQLRLFKDD